MAGLFDLPASRTNKGADINVVNKSTNRKSAQVVSRGGGLLEKIATINSLVESKLGKYKDNYTYFMAKDEEQLLNILLMFVTDLVSSYSSIPTKDLTDSLENM